MTVSGTPGMSCSERISLAITSQVTEPSLRYVPPGDLWMWNECWMLMSVFLPGSAGDVSECDSCGSSEGQSSHQGNNKLPVRPTQMSLGVLESRPHLPVTRSSSGPHDQRRQRQGESSLHQALGSQSGANSSDDLAQRTGRPACPLLNARTDRPLRDTHISHSTPSLFTYQPDPRTIQQPQQSPALQTVDTTRASGPAEERGPGTSNCQTERWHIWKMLSKENPESLPETLV